MTLKISLKVVGNVAEVTPATKTDRFPHFLLESMDRSR